MKNKWLFKLGGVLMMFACVSWISLLIIPFLSLSFGVKAASATGLIVLGEVFFWLGTLCLGKQVFDKFKGHILFGKRAKKENE